MTTLYTIGFTKTGAEHFFERLRDAGVRRLVDVRLHNTSTLAGFTKRDDLRYFLRAILGAEYQHELLLAPTEELIKAYRSKQLDWDGYAERFVGLLRERRVEEVLQPADFTGPTVLLCSEPTAERCHRRLVTGYLAQAWGGLEIVHL